MTALLKLIARYPAIRHCDLARAVTQQGRQAGKPLSGAAMSRLIHFDQWPRETPREAIEQQISAYLTAKGVPKAEIEELWTPVTPAAQSSFNRPEANPEAPTEKKATTMIPKAQTLSRQARTAFGLSRPPFEGFPKAATDYFLTDNMREVLEAINEAADISVMRAIVGTSGAGKTTLKKYYRQGMGSTVKLIEVLVTTMSDNERAGGKIMPSTQIHSAIIRAFDEHRSIPSHSDDRQRVCRNLLLRAAEGGLKPLLMIDEAHDLAFQTLSHLKRLHELAEGSMGIILIGQPRLADKLNPKLSPEIQEAGQRFPVERLQPMDATEIHAYIDHRLKLAGSSWAQVFDPQPAPIYDAQRKLTNPGPANAIEQALTRLEQQGRGAAAVVSEAYPLAVNNLATAAINRAALRGFERVSADLVIAAAREV